MNAPGRDAGLPVHDVPLPECHDSSAEGLPCGSGPEAAMNIERSRESGGWYFYGMRTAIDSAGRVVIPKALRDALGLTAGQPLEITEQDGRLEIVPAATPMRLVDEGDGVAAVADADMPVLTTDMVRDTLERIRR
jgi:AbrB family looped-hinge helix DNA binding protein